MEQQKSEREILAALEQLRKAKKYKEFFTLAEEGVASYPDSFPVRFLFAEVLVEAKQLTEAEDVFKDLIVAYPDNINLLLDLGKVTFTLEKYDEAAEYLNKILFLDPFNYQAKELLVRIDKIKAGRLAGKPAVAPSEPPAYPPQTAGPDELVMPGSPAEEPAPRRSDIDTTPFTAPTKPEDELEAEQKPDFDTKKVEFDIPTSVGSPGQPPPAPAVPGPVETGADAEFGMPLALDEQPAAPPAGPPSAPAVTEVTQTEMEFDIPSLTEPDQPPPPAPGPPPAPAAEEETITEIEFEIPSLAEPDQPAAPAAVPPPIPAEPEPVKKEYEMEFEIPAMAEPDQPPPIPGPPPIPTGQEKQTADIEFEIPSMGEAELTVPEPPPIPTEPEPVKKEYEMELEIPGMAEPVLPPPPPGPPPIPTGQDKQTADIEFEIPSLQETDSPPPGPPPIPVDQEEKKMETVPPAQAPDFDTKKVEFIQQPEARKDAEFEIPPPPDMNKTSEPVEQKTGIEYEIPATGETGQEEIEIDYEMPKKEAELPESETVADTIVEMEAPKIPGVEQGPPIPPPPAATPPLLEYGIPASAEMAAADEEFEILSAREESQEDLKVEYESPAQAPITADVDFEIPSAREESQEEIRVEYESPAQEVSLEADDIYEMPPVRETEPEEMETEPEAIQPETEEIQAAPVTPEPEEKEKDGQIQQEEADFMTESAAELYLSQGLLDDALNIYEKLYRVQKDEKYLDKIRKISEQRVNEKKIQALTRLLNLIDKKGERRV